jgi:hypothetical protein
MLRVFEIRLVRRISGPRKHERTGSWKKLHNVKIHYFYFSANIIRMNTPRRMRWAGHVARMGVKNECMRGFGMKS